MKVKSDGEKVFAARSNVTLLAWGNTIEDFLDPLNISLEHFCTQFTGSWVFGYINALKTTNIRAVLICVSGQINETQTFTHIPTGATIKVLPASRIYRLIRPHIINPYGRTVNQIFRKTNRAGFLLYPLFWLLKEILLYLPTPIGLLAREIKQEKCDAVLCQEYEYPRFDVSVILGKLVGLPVFASFQGGSYQRSRLEKLLRPFTMGACSGLIIGSTTEIQRVRTRYRLDSSHIAHIFNPVDTQFWKSTDRSQARQSLGIPTEACVAAWHGRISIGQKGLDTLLASWKQICDERPGEDLRLLLVGTGKDADLLRQQIAELGLKNIQWLNEFVSDRSIIRTYLSAADVYVFSSRHEGFPVALVEAMSCGLPVVATDASGVADIIAEGEESGGFIVPCDSPEALSSLLGKVMDDRLLRNELSKNARHRVEANFSLEVVGKQLSEFLLESMEGCLKI